MAPCEALYGRRFWSPIGLFEVGKSSVLDPYLINKTLEKFHVIRNLTQTAHSRHKYYSNHRRRDLQFEKGYNVYLKILPMKGVV